MPGKCPEMLDRHTNTHVHKQPNAQLHQHTDGKCDPVQRERAKVLDGYSESDPDADSNRVTHRSAQPTGDLYSVEEWATKAPRLRHGYRARGIHERRADRDTVVR
jgi:hypothetical protein